MNSDHFGRQVSVPSFGQAAPNTNTPNDSATEYGSVEPGVTTLPNPHGSVSATPERAYTPLLPDLSEYDLTIGEALEVFPTENRKQPSIRTLQRYCQEGRFDCYKLKTTRNGNPVHEWIINGASLRSFIQTKPEETVDTPLATPAAIGDAEPGRKTETSGDAKPDVIATPGRVDDANGEQRSRVALLIENAKLTARMDAQEDLIGELREDKKFMREQIVHQRGNDTLMADMHRETLHTLKAVSVAGRHTRIEMPGASAGKKGSEFYDAQDGENRPQPDRPDSV